MDFVFPSKWTNNYCEDNDDDYLLGEAGSELVDGEIAPLTNELEEDSMAIDEEGRPRFAPSRDIVSISSTICKGWGKAIC